MKKIQGNVLKVRGEYLRQIGINFNAKTFFIQVIDVNMK